MRKELVTAITKEMIYFSAGKIFSRGVFVISLYLFFFFNVVFQTEKIEMEGMNNACVPNKKMAGLD